MGPSCLWQSNASDIAMKFFAFCLHSWFLSGFTMAMDLVKNLSGSHDTVRRPFQKHGPSLALVTLMLNLKNSKPKWRHQVDKRNVRNVAWRKLSYIGQKITWSCKGMCNSFMLWMNEKGNPTFRTPFMPLTTPSNTIVVSVRPNLFPKRTVCAPAPSKIQSKSPLSWTSSMKWSAAALNSSSCKIQIGNLSSIAILQTKQNLDMRRAISTTCLKGRGKAPRNVKRNIFPTFWQKNFCINRMVKIVPALRVLVFFSARRRWACWRARKLGLEFVLLVLFWNF